MSNNEFWRSDDYSGPYKSMIPHDKSVKDNCAASLNNTQALKPLTVGDSVEVRVQYDTTTVKYETEVKEPGDYLTLPVHVREKLGLRPRDDVLFWVKKQEPDTGEKVAIKPKSKVYHYVEDGEIACNKTHATKPGTTDNGFLIATLDEVSDEWRPCETCVGTKGTSDATYTELVSGIQSYLGTGRDTTSFNKEELTLIANELTDGNLSEVLDDE